MSIIVESVLYIGDNYQLVNTILNLSGTASAKLNYDIHHLSSVSSVDDIQAALAERKYAHFICEQPFSQYLADQIATDFPSLKTTYLPPPKKAKATELAVAMEGLVSDEVKETLDYLSIPIYFKNKKGQFLACNSYFAHLVGKTPAQVIGKTAAEVLPAELSDEIEKIDQKVFTEQQVYLHECKLHDFAGRERDIVFRKESVASGNIQIGMVFDVTEINEARALLEKERIMLRTTADISADLIFFKDLESRFLGCNRQFEKFVGYPEREIVGKNDDKLFEREQAAMCQAQDREVMTKNRIYVGEEL
ncbi:MAG TPA: PAS domain-containing protein, partial [Psychromonas sp.]